MEKQERKIKVRLLRPLFYRSSKGMLAGKTDEVVSLAESDAQGLFRSGAVVPDDLPPMVRCRALVTADVSCPEDPGERYSFIRNEEYSVPARIRSEEHTSELQSPLNLVCR